MINGRQVTISFEKNRGIPSAVTTKSVVRSGKYAFFEGPNHTPEILL